MSTTSYVYSDSLATAQSTGVRVFLLYLIGTCLKICKARGEMGWTGLNSSHPAGVNVRPWGNRSSWGKGSLLEGFNCLMPKRPITVLRVKGAAGFAVKPPDDGDIACDI